jgi:hypothetical protein
VKIGERLTNMVQQQLRLWRCHAINVSGHGNPAAVIQPRRSQGPCHHTRIPCDDKDNLNINTVTHAQQQRMRLPIMQPDPSQCSHAVYSRLTSLTKDNPYSTDAILGCLGAALHSIMRHSLLVQWFMLDATTQYPGSISASIKGKRPFEEEE